MRLLQSTIFHRNLFHIQKTGSIRKETRTQFRFGDGKEIKIEPGTNYSSIWFKFFPGKPKATPEQFFILKEGIEALVTQLGNEGKLPKDWIETVATPQDVNVPEIPEYILEQVPENMEINIVLRGETLFDVSCDYTQEYLDEQERLRQEEEFDGEVEVDE